MRAVVQRVLEASVAVDGSVAAKIGRGFLVFVGVMDGDGEKDAAYIRKKLCGLRVFGDAEGKMNLPITEIGGEMLIVSQFTLAGDARHGNRPEFTSSAAPETGKLLYDLLCENVAETVPVGKGVFGADMKVSLVNDGPVTILLDSSKLF